MRRKIGEDSSMLNLYVESFAHAFQSVHVCWLKTPWDVLVRGHFKSAYSMNG
jgi:hypothetical protein